MKKLNTAILGSGNIGSDILIKIMKNPNLKCVLFAGRRKNSEGIKMAKDLGINTSSEGIESLIKCPEQYDLVFDATSAIDHIDHAKVLRQLGKFVVNLTPAKIGKFCVPALNPSAIFNVNNVNMITCGGQASIPIAWAISQVHNSLDYVEIVSNISSKSAGPATRLNLDEYIATTEKALRYFTNCKKSKVILTLNPAEPCVNMQSTIMVLMDKPNIEEITKKVQQIEAKIKSYVPGYGIVLGPIYEKNRLIVSLQVKGAGNYLPEYAGNLDIITCAAIKIAETFNEKRTANL